jgi:hypothetical protein
MLSFTGMQTLMKHIYGKPRALCGYAAITMAMLFCTRATWAQETPLISGGGGFFSSTNGGNTSYQPVINPLIVVPIGPRFQIESRAALSETFFPVPGKGYDHSHFVALTYLQGDFFLSKHMTIVAGSFLVPFATYNERLTPIWIGNFQSAPLILSLGTAGTGTALGGQVRGSAISRQKYSIDYAAYYSTRTSNMQFEAERSFGGRSSIYLPEKRLELGLSYQRVLQGTHENFYAGHLWWEPAGTAFRLRSEFSRGHHAQGYWAEFDYRTKAFGGLDSFVGRIEPVFRMQQTWRRDQIVSDGVPMVNTVRADFGLDYNLPHNTRILTSYSRQFASTGNVNIWQTGIVYRFLFPAWKGGK